MLTYLAGPIAVGRKETAVEGEDACTDCGKIERWKSELGWTVAEWARFGSRWRVRWWGWRDERGKG
jgi:hypothetical protein